jgi:hypothetical protein
MCSDRHEPIDVLIPLGPRDRETVTLTARSARAFVEGARNIYIVCRDDPGIEGTRFVDERAFPFDLESVRRLLGTHDRAGWYLQQLIKLHFPLIEPGCLDRVLVVDADTIFLRKCRFIEDGRIVFNFGDEHHVPYFEHMARMHPALRKLIVYSGITHCMLFDRRWLAELMSAVESHHHKQSPFWKLFLTAVDPNHRDSSGASEYETYFNFCLGRYPNDLFIRRFRWRNIATIDEVRPDLYDYVSLHWHGLKESVDYQRLTSKIFPPE